MALPENTNTKPTHPAWNRECHSLFQSVGLQLKTTLKTSSTKFPSHFNLVHFLFPIAKRRVSSKLPSCKPALMQFLNQQRFLETWLGETGDFNQSVKNIHLSTFLTLKSLDKYTIEISSHESHHRCYTIQCHNHHRAIESQVAPPSSCQLPAASLETTAVVLPIDELLTYKLKNSHLTNDANSSLWLSPANFSATSTTYQLLVTTVLCYPHESAESLWVCCNESIRSPSSW